LSQTDPSSHRPAISTMSMSASILLARLLARRDAAAALLAGLHCRQTLLGVQDDRLPD
jgi:hypothetical protein